MDDDITEILFLSGYGSFVVCMMPPAPAGGPTQTFYTLAVYRGVTSPKLTLLVVLLPCADGKNFGENRFQQQVGRVGSGLVPPTRGPHYPRSSDKIPRCIAPSSQFFLPPICVISSNRCGFTESQLQSSAEREHRSMVQVDHALGSP